MENKIRMIKHMRIEKYLEQASKKEEEQKISASVKYVWQNPIKKNTAREICLGLFVLSNEALEEEDSTLIISFEGSISSCSQ